jgi:diguanylate cyclase (GGDEF)-like protein/PAS domain S-box-containing protein
MTKEGQYVGIASDLIGLITQRSNMTYSIVQTRDWEESIAFSKQGLCDGLAFTNQTPQRDKWLVFTEPYFTDPNVIIATEKSEYISNLSALQNTTIALPKGSSILEKVQKNFPNLRIIEVTSEEEAFELVSQGKADITLRSLTMAVYTIKKNGWFNLKVAGEVPEYVNKLRIGISHEKAFFKETLNKGILTLKPQEVLEISNKHVAITVEKKFRVEEFANYLIGFFLLIVFGIAFLIYQQRMNKKLETLNERYKSVIEGSREGIVVTQDFKIIFANPYFCEISGYRLEELSNISIEHYFHEEDRQRVMENHTKRIAKQKAENRYNVRFLTKSGETIWVEISGALIFWGEKPATLNFIVDVTQRIESERKIKHMAHHDALTGLANRWLLDDRLDRQIALSQRDKSSFSLLFVDLNKFKPINDTYGHEAGDTVLKIVAQRLVGLLRESDTIARIGGDEYVILLTHIKSHEDAQKIAQKIHNLFSEPFDVTHPSIYLTCSIGIALFPHDGTTRDALYTHADQSMYQNKNLSEEAYM